MLGGRSKTAIQSSGFAIVAAKTDSVYVRVLGSKALYYAPRTIIASVVDHYDFVGKAVFFHYSGNPCGEFRK